MSYREVSLEEIREVIRLWLAGHGIMPLAARLGPDPKTVRRYVAGEVLRTLDEARAWARMWCLAEAGERLHSHTQRRPREHFLAQASNQSRSRGAVPGRTESPRGS